MACLSPTGCSRNRYEIELKPDAETMERSLTCWREQGDSGLASFPEAELKQMAAAYGQFPPASEARQYTFHGKFVGEMPNDIGGSGRQTYWTTRMGTLSLYVERFRGDDDLMGSLQTRLDAADRFTSLLLGWFRSELKHDPAAAKLEEFVDGPFRRDIRNLVLYCWAGQIAAGPGPAQFGEKPPADDPEPFVRIAQYFMERGYFTPAKLCELIRTDANGDADRFLTFVRTFLGSKMGNRSAEQAAQRLAFLESPERAEQSLDAYLAGTDEGKAFVQREKQKHNEDPNAAPPKPHELLGKLAIEAMGMEFSVSDELQVKVACPVEPFSTNGRWEAEARQVVWSRRINAGGERAAPVLPAVFYVFWSVPDEGFQREHFGKVVLGDKSLAEYCVWWKGLTAAEAKEWDEFLASLTPGTLAQRLEAFRFSTDPPPAAGEEKAASLADKPRELIEAGLKDP